jgi:predicted phage terminase large subunit-like protein
MKKAGPTDRNVADAVYRANFPAFTYRAYLELYRESLEPNWHIGCICYRLQQMVLRQCDPRLVLNAPPRTLKSRITSVFLPAWILGRDPAERIICASYSVDLASTFSRDCRALMETRFYKRVFPQTKLNPRKAAEAEFETTRRGSRFATSVGGTLTGRGCGVLLIDDPLKADDAASEVARTGANDWFRNTALSRRDEPGKSLVAVTMQRLHAADLSGTLIEAGWPSLVLPQIASEDADYDIGEDELYHRRAGQLLQPNRDDLAAFEDIRVHIGSAVWAAQYQQNPTPPDGNMVNRNWLRRYDTVPDRRKFPQVILSCDPAGKPGPNNDYTAIVIVGIADGKFYLLEVIRGRWLVQEMVGQIQFLAQRWRPQFTLIEDTSSGMALLQELRRACPFLNLGRSLPRADKESRMVRHQGCFEAGRVVLPKEAVWLADFERELFAFPQGKHDDQVDALLQFLDWAAQNEQYGGIVGFAAPILVTAPPSHTRFDHPGW